MRFLNRFPVADHLRQCRWKKRSAEEFNGWCEKGSTILPRCEVPIFAMPNIPTGQALVLMAVVILIMVFFPPLLSQIIFGALMLYILYRVVTNYD
jgi:hypothetical protein